MGNVPISCCRSKSPRLQQSSASNRGNHKNGSDNQYSAADHDILNGGKHSNRTRSGEEHDQPSHILQHISEREPDDSETDPSSNPLNRPIFAARSSSAKNKTTNYTDSYSSNNSRRQTNTPLISSQDHGYNSTTSTNLTHYDGLQNDSFDNNIQRQQQAIKVNDGLTNDDNTLLVESRLLLLNSVSSSENVGKLSPSVSRIESGSNNDARFYSEDRFKSSSCSTIFIDGSTISQPNLKQTIKCVSLAIYYHIKNRTSDSSAEIFDDSINPLKMPSANDKDQLLMCMQEELITLDQERQFDEVTLDEPDQHTIYDFVNTLFKAAQLTSEYAITTLVYLERLMTYAEMDLTPRTWRRMFLGAILLSSKVWEDQAVWNVDYAQILEEISVEDINELERQFLELIQFNMNVPSSVYAKYYFHLRTLALKHGLSGENCLLRLGEAKTLEAMSRVQTNEWQSSPIHRKTSPVVKRHTSLERLRLNGHAPAVLM